MWRLKSFLGWILSVCLLAVAGVVWVYVQLQQPLVVTSAYKFNVAPGANLNSTLDTLQREGVVAQPRLLSYYARISNQSEIRHGEYQVESADTALDLLAKLHLGLNVQYRLSLIEGWTLAQVLQEIANTADIKKTLDAERIAEALGIQGHPEGWLHPNTYSYSSQNTDAEILQQALRLQQEILISAWEERSGFEVLKTPYEALILASVVEKETAVDDEREEIAGVFIRRLQKNMRLQSDPTVIYGLGDAYQNDITSTHLRTKTPYNTYRINGLPPTPICMPGEASIRAVLNPAEGDTLYFVARNDGSGRHQFSKTLAEHEQAVRAMLKR